MAEEQEICVIKPDSLETDLKICLFYIGEEYQKEPNIKILNQQLMWTYVCNHLSKEMEK